jgi:hypothetical protein
MAIEDPASVARCLRMARWSLADDNARMECASLKSYAWLSIAAALATLALKGVAWLLTGSVGLLSDALESVVNLAGAAMALAMLTVAERPADEGHAFGHGKAEYFSSGFEGLLILIAAAAIAIAAIERLLSSAGTRADRGWADGIGAGLSDQSCRRPHSAACRPATAINHPRSRCAPLADRCLDIGRSDPWRCRSGSHGMVMARPVAGAAGRQQYRVDCLAPAATYDRRADGWQPAAGAARTGTCHPGALSGAGYRLPCLATRESGARRFISLHVLVPGVWTIDHGHQLLEDIEREIRQALPHTSVFTHLEPLDDPASQDDIGLDR